MTSMVTSKRKQWAWFVGLWLAGFLTVGAISLVIKAIMNIG
jgi:hypothetical protein